MEPKQALGVAAAISFSAILFSPKGSNIWPYFALLCVVFTLAWVVKE